MAGFLDIDRLFEGRRFDREIIVLCVRERTLWEQYAALSGFEVVVAQTGGRCRRSGCFLSGQGASLRL